MPFFRAGWVVGSLEEISWFLIIYLKDYHSDETVPENFELFKYGQDLSAKIWLAIVSSTFVIFFWKDIHLFVK
jgi:hypothetical protein